MEQGFWSHLTHVHVNTVSLKRTRARPRPLWVLPVSSLHGLPNPGQEPRGTFPSSLSSPEANLSPSPMDPVPKIASSCASPHQTCHCLNSGPPRLLLPGPLELPPSFSSCSTPHAPAQTPAQCLLWNVKRILSFSDSKTPSSFLVHQSIPYCVLLQGSCPSGGGGEKTKNK